MKSTFTTPTDGVEAAGSTPVNDCAPPLLDSPWMSIFSKTSVWLPSQR